MDKETKKCRECGRELPLTSFSILRRSPDGRHSRCKECDNAYQRAYMAKKRGQMQTTPTNSLNPEFAGKTPRELIQNVRELVNELRARGYSYEGKLTYLQTIEI